MTYTSEEIYNMKDIQNIINNDREDLEIADMIFLINGEMMSSTHYGFHDLYDEETLYKILKKLKPILEMYEDYEIEKNLMEHLFIRFNWLQVNAGVLIKKMIDIGFTLDILGNCYEFTRTIDGIKYEILFDCRDWNTFNIIFDYTIEMS